MPASRSVLVATFTPSIDCIGFSNSVKDNFVVGYLNVLTADGIILILSASLFLVNSAMR